MVYCAQIRLIESQRIPITPNYYTNSLITIADKSSIQNHRVCKDLASNVCSSLENERKEVQSHSFDIVHRQGAFSQGKESSNNHANNFVNCPAYSLKIEHEQSIHFSEKLEITNYVCQVLRGSISVGQIDWLNQMGQNNWVKFRGFNFEWSRVYWNVVKIEQGGMSILKSRISKICSDFTLVCPKS